LDFVSSNLILAEPDMCQYPLRIPCCAKTNFLIFSAGWLLFLLGTIFERNYGEQSNSNSEIQADSKWDRPRMVNPLAKQMSLFLRTARKLKCTHRQWNEYLSNCASSAGAACFWRCTPRLKHRNSLCRLEGCGWWYNSAGRSRSVPECV
jgi:hypothetical protein